MTRNHVSTMERASVTLDIETGKYFREFSFLSGRKLGEYTYRGSDSCDHYSESTTNELEFYYTEDDTDNEDDEYDEDDHTDYDVDSVPTSLVLVGKGPDPDPIDSEYSEGNHNGNDAECTGPEPQQTDRMTDRDPDDYLADKNASAGDNDDEDEYSLCYLCSRYCKRNEDPDIISHIVTKLIQPSVEHLYLERMCRRKHFHAAMKAGKASVLNLSVDVQSYTDAKLEILTRMIRGMVQLNSLTIRNLTRHPYLRPGPAFFQDMTVCATLTRVQLLRFHSKSAAKLQAIATRNSELARFVANPSSICPTADAMLSLVRQFSETDCPSGLYLLARALPAVISFDKIHSKDASPKPKQKKQKV